MVAIMIASRARDFYRFVLGPDLAMQLGCNCESLTSYPPRTPFVLGKPLLWRLMNHTAILTAALLIAHPECCPLFGKFVVLGGFDATADVFTCLDDMREAPERAHEIADQIGDRIHVSRTGELRGVSRAGAA